MRPQKIFRGIFLVAFFVSLLQEAVFLSKTFLFDKGVCNPSFFLAQLSREVILIFSVFTLGTFLYFWRKEERKSTEIFWILILSGGISNLLERSISGCVFDYLKLPYTPYFNLADIFLTVGVVGILGKYAQEKMKNK